MNQGAIRQICCKRMYWRANCHLARTADAGESPGAAGQAEIVLDSACAVPTSPHKIKIAIVNEITAFLFFMYAVLMVGILSHNNNILRRTASQALEITTKLSEIPGCV